MKRSKGNKISGQFVPLPHNLLDSAAFKGLDNTSKVSLIYFQKDKKSSHQTQLILTYPQARHYGVCKSPATFNKSKKELVEKGFLDPDQPGGLGKCSVFKESMRWKNYGTKNFVQMEFKPGCGSKYFQVIWKNKKASQRLMDARHKKK